MNKTDMLHLAISPTTFLLSKAAEKTVQKAQEIAQKKSSLQELKEEAMRLEIIMQMEAAQAKVAQELAIAQRISTAHTVVIEEYYDVSGKGGLQAGSSEAGFTGGLTGEGRKITQRNYRFTGWHEGALQEVEQQMNSKEEDE